MSAGLDTSVQKLIPTLHKSKISHLLSYPVGAETVSTALYGVPQFNKLILRFFFWSDNELRRGNYEFIRIEYRNRYQSKEWTRLGLHGRTEQYRWEIVVHPVPRVFRNRVHDLAISEALPAIREWLEAHAVLDRQGTYIFAFFYDEKTDAISIERFDKLEPARG